ncbi:hypothetical protein RQP46_007025 [Phenoliferia psychrophenolica]
MSNTASFDDEKALGDAHGVAGVAVVPALHDGPVDKALALLEDSGSIQADPATMNRLRWRIDMRLMPTMILCYLLMVRLGDVFKI